VTEPAEPGDLLRVAHQPAEVLQLLQSQFRLVGAAGPVAAPDELGEPVQVNPQQGVSHLFVQRPDSAHLRQHFRSGIHVPGHDRHGPAIERQAQVVPGAPLGPLQVGRPVAGRQVMETPEAALRQFQVRLLGGQRHIAAQVQPLPVRGVVSEELLHRLGRLGGVAGLEVGESQVEQYLLAAVGVLLRLQIDAVELGDGLGPLALIQVEARRLQRPPARVALPDDPDELGQRATAGDHQHEDANQDRAAQDRVEHAGRPGADGLRQLCESTANCRREVADRCAPAGQEQPQGGAAGGERGQHVRQQMGEHPGAVGAVAHLVHHRVAAED